MNRVIVAQPLTRENFAEFGDVIDKGGDLHYPINGGKTERFHDLARAEAAGPNARVLINIFKATPYEFPLTLRWSSAIPSAARPSCRCRRALHRRRLP